MRIIPALLCALALAAGGAAAPAVAADPDAATPPALAAPGAVKPAAVGPKTNHKLISVFTNYAKVTSTPFGSGFTDIATQDIKCANQAGCTLTFHLYGEATGPTGSPWALCATVGGVLANPAPGGGCPFISTFAGSYTTGTAQFSYTVPLGTYTVVFQAYGSTGSSLFTWSTEYGLYTP